MTVRDRLYTIPGMNAKISIPCMLAAATFLLAACGPDAGDEEAVNAYLADLSDRMNKRLPDMVEENTVLEATSGYNGKFTYYYTLLNYDADAVDPERFVKRMKPALLENACTSETMEPLIDLDVTLQYIYSDKERVEFAAIAVDPAECRDL